MLLASVLGVSAILTVLFASADLRLVVRWGVTWGIVLGVWVITPRWLSVHHLHPESVLQWMEVTAFIALVTGAIGGMASLLAGWPWAGLLLLRGQRYRDRVVGPAAFALVSATAGYVAVSLLLEWMPFGKITGLGESPGRFWIGAGCYLLVCVIGVLAHRRFAESFGAHTSRWISRSAIVALVSGLAILPARTGVEEQKAARVMPLLTKATGQPRRQLIVIGLDAGNWKTLRPLIDAGRLPTLGRLVENGMTGTVKAEWPPYWSAPAWAAIVTGHDRDETGVREDITARAPGLPPFELSLRLDVRLNPIYAVERLLVAAGLIRTTLMPRESLRVSPIWERLPPAGVRTAVVRFPFTHPAHGQADVVISYMVAADLWGALGVKAGAPWELGSPSRWAAAAAERFAAPPDARPFLDLFPQGSWRKPADAVVDPLTVLRTMVDIEHRVLDLAERVVGEEPGLDVVMLFIGSHDEVSHAFWQYRFPEDFPESALDRSDVSALGPVIDRYLIYLDGRIGQILARSPDANVMLVSDHGLHSTPGEPMWKGWHSPEGIFLAAGPDIPRTPEPVRVSYYDIVPTMLDLAGVAPAADQSGNSLVRRH